MPTPTVENYVKQIYLQQQDQPPHGSVTTGALAERMGVVPGTATSMAKALADEKLVTYEARLGVRLTPTGELLALQVLRRHRLVELLLVRILGLDWSEVHAEAEEIEHCISEKVLERIDEVLGRPMTDPHGDPIPSPLGRLASAAVRPLCEFPAGAVVTVARVVDQQKDFLKFADRCGLTPGTRVTIESQDTAADAVTLRVDGKDAVTLGIAAAKKILASAA